MAIEGFDYKGFATELATQAKELIPKDFQEFHINYILNTIQNFSTMCGESINNDASLNFNLDQAMLITQIIAEWSFHKSIDLIRSGVMPEYWDSVMQKIAFTIFEVAKQTISKGINQDEILKVVEHHVKKAYEKAITDLKNRGVIDDGILQTALGQSNIDAMMQTMQAEAQTQQLQNGGDGSNKVLKLASVALLLRQLRQDKVQTILNKFNQEDAQMVIQYMQMDDLDRKIDASITVKCLKEIKGHLPEPKHLSPQKVISRMNLLFNSVDKQKMDRIISKERSKVKEFVKKAKEGEFFEMTPKVTNIIIQHLEESAAV